MAVRQEGAPTRTVSNPCFKLGSFIDVGLATPYAERYARFSGLPNELVMRRKLWNLGTITDYNTAQAARNRH